MYNALNRTCKLHDIENKMAVQSHNSLPFPLSFYVQTIVASLAILAAFRQQHFAKSEQKPDISH